MITYSQFEQGLRISHQGQLPLDAEQQKAVHHDYQTPLWIIAGPGTGKTHTLVWLVLKRMLVDDIQPEKIILTTFTRKAAAELESRLILNRQKLIAAGLAEAETIEPSKLHIGTLHSLCSDILQNERYDPTLRIRVLEDELTQQFFVRRSRNPLMECDDLSFWRRFGLGDQRSNFAPTKAKKAEGACKLFNRITENGADVDAMLNSGDIDFVRLGDAYLRYQLALRDSHRTDQAHMQRHFLDFLGTREGKAFLGDGFTVLVDEYQDTNPVQEQIYFKLTGKGNDLTVVGDDDQSLYRFRGATVESLIDFDRSCRAYKKKKPTAVYLRENRRSHPQVVDWVNRFIKHHPEMNDPLIRVRAPGKMDLVPKSNIVGNYPAVMAIVETQNPPAAQKVVNTINQMMQAKPRLIEDYSQVALLTFSTRETTHAIGAYTNALRTAGIPIYNPRNKRAQTDGRLRSMIGALSCILDPDFPNSDLPANLPRGVPQYITQARQDFANLASSGLYPDLRKYVDASAQAVRNSAIDSSKTYNWLTRSGGRRVTLSGLLFKLLSHNPFANDLTDPEGGERLKALNLIQAEYESLFDDGELRIEASPAGGARIDRWTLYNFYAVFVEGIHDGLNDPEDEEVSIQEGMVNVMTIHQSKGLQFEVVFVLRPDKQPFLSDTHIIEDEIEPYVNRPHKPARRSQQLRVAEDAVRLFFVAYSRAKRLLILTGTNISDWDRVLGRDANGNQINAVSRLRSQGVHIL